MKRIKVREITGSDTLAGKCGGSRDFLKLMAAVEDSPEGSTVILDWTGVEVATASYFGATFVRLLRMTMAGDMDRYLVLTGLNRTCLDELKLALELQGLVALLGDRGKNGAIESLQFFGTMEPAYVQTFAEVQKARGVSASELHKRQVPTHNPIGKTGWINRLSNLHRLRLVRKQKVGREFVFKPVNKEV
jgi:hypothetical protein